jgi:cupin 2 domain-containing protein
VILLSGKATILFAEDNNSVDLGLGDYLHIKGHQKHKVTFTDPNEPSVWLCLFFSDDDQKVS